MLDVYQTQIIHMASSNGNLPPPLPSQPLPLATAPPTTAPPTAANRVTMLFSPSKAQQWLKDCRDWEGQEGWESTAKRATLTQHKARWGMKGSCIRLWLREHIYMKLGSWVFSVDAVNVCWEISGQKKSLYHKVGQSFSPLKWTGSTTNSGTAGQAVDMNGNWVSSRYVPTTVGYQRG